MLTIMTDNAAYGWRHAALFTSEMAAFAAFTDGKKRTAPATARHGAARAWNGPIT
ncbi:MAG: hypothetical protein ACTHOG_01870 [Marmoricola sp.]